MVLITGGSSGIGLAFAKYYASKKKELLLVSDQEIELFSCAIELTEHFEVRVETICIDLAKHESAMKVYEEVKEKGYEIDVLINGAAFATKGLFAESDLGRLHEEVNLNIQTVMDLTYLFLNDMLKVNRGTIINMASTSGYTPSPYNAVYAATKSFVLNFTSALYYEYRKSNVNILAVCPIATRTHFFDNSVSLTTHMREPEDVVRTTIRALEKHQMMAVDGFLGKLQAMCSHLGTIKMRTYVVGLMCRKWKNYR